MTFPTYLCTLLLLSLFSAAPPTYDLKPVKTDAGLISGTTNADGSIRIFKGIPFAAPPVGELRWKAPQPAPAWKGVRACTQFGPSPMQGAPAPFSMWSEEFLIPKEPISEDCLYLNVWTGAQSADEKRPVLVWIYGGGFSSGGSAVPIYDGEAMAKKGIVFVSLNYRVGHFGFFAHPDLTKESGHGASGNYGLMDQIAGLHWVQRNIARFGGDPANVTIAGQSAGSMSVNGLVASPLARGLFTKAIAQSGANFSRGSATLAQAEAAGQQVAQAVSASSLAALRKVPAATLLQQPQSVRGPIIDGYVLPEPIAAIFAGGHENPVTLLTGWNQDEGLLFGPIKNAADFRQQAEEQYGTEATTFLQFYPATTDDEAAASQLALSRDLIFGAQNYTWANVASDRERPVYVYRFTRKVPATGEYVKYGAFHTGEVPYAYDNLRFVNRPWEPVDRQLAETMSSYWTNFIKTGNPNGAGLPAWPAYTRKTQQIMDLGVAPSAKPLPDAATLDFLQSHLPTP
ncbi:para-nitrobenzyl esterase [Catalinimonas alkaloidigena]|uniref:Carboxylic ester hydrolase n=1 Tax=Catalinimonas alkaloidigena TaxID=1075417 RepID=A0A1G9P402_9BACT|nr:carboxylesterase family protein [Catalinimonas alkaloidigena]SDL92925.1 para-nitrobenzyl esterase [Catalinimonas alkaloidigena]